MLNKNYQERMFRCEYCLEWVLNGDTYYYGKDENYEWHTCCAECVAGDWYYLEDGHGNVLIPESAFLVSFPLEEEDNDH